MSLLTLRNYYKPFEFPWAFEAYELQNQIHWLASEIPLHDDVSDWNNKLTDNEKNLLTHVFRYLVAADLDVSNGYLDKFIPLFPVPEIRMMLATFAATEQIHEHAYSLFIDTIGMHESEYQAFKEYPAIQDKHDFLNQFRPDLLLNCLQDSDNDPTEGVGVTESDLLKELAKTLAVYAAFNEGLVLFSSFAIILNFTRHNKMKGMGQIISYIQRDEDLHCQSMIKLFHAFIDENPKIWKKDLKQQIYQACRDTVDLELKFIDLAFEFGDIEGLTKEDMQQYVYYLADRRLLQLRLKPEYKVKKNPLPWLDYLVNGVEFANFFESKATEYSKATLTGSWKDVWSQYD